MAVRPAADRGSVTLDDADGTTDETSTASPGGARVFRLVLLSVLVVAFVAGSAVFASAVASRSSSAGAGWFDRATGAVTGDDSVQQEREQVMNAASQFMLRVQTYGPDLLDENGAMPEYRALVSEVITPNLLTSFEESASIPEQLVAQSGQAREAELYGTGVASMDADSATALVSGYFVNSYPASQAAGGDGSDGSDGSAEGSDADDESTPERVEDVPTPFRVAVTLVKIDGEWLVDDYSPVSGTSQPTLPQTPEDGGTNDGGNGNGGGNGSGGNGSGGNGNGGGNGSGGNGGGQ